METAPFSGDQGRDLLEIRTALIANQIPLAGPLSNSSIHAGPVYYYLAIPALLVTKYQPLGPILLFTCFGVITSLLFWYLGQQLWGPLPALIISLTYAISSYTIQQTLGFWNPIPIPMFILLIIYSLWQIQEEKKYPWFILLGFFLGCVTQFYPPANFLLIVVFFWWFLAVRRIPKKWLIFGLLAFVFSLLPFLIFQIQNNWSDVKNTLLFVLENVFIANNHSFDLISRAGLFLNFLAYQIRPLTAIPNLVLNMIFGVILLAASFLNHDKPFWSRFFTIWLLAGLIVLSFYPGPVHPHHTSFIWLIAFFLFGLFIKKLERILPKNIILFIAVIFILYHIKFYFQNLTVRNNLNRSRQIAELISSQAQKQPFSLVLRSSESESDAHLRYLLNLTGAKVTDEINLEKNKFLFLVCEPVCGEPKLLTNLVIKESICLPNCPPPGQEKYLDLKQWLFLRRILLPEASIDIFQKHQNP